MMLVGALLAQDPRLYGQAANGFYVIYAQLAADKLKLVDERAVIPQLLKQYPCALFIFSDKSQANFHFVNVKWENSQKRRLYRRITVGPQERLRTAVERISMLDTQKIYGGPFGITQQKIQDKHDEAFDVAKVYLSRMSLWDWGEAEGILRQLRAEYPTEFDRIASLRDGIRSGMNSLHAGMFVFCQAGDFQQLFFVDPLGQIETRDASTILGRLKCTPSTPAMPLSKNYNAGVMQIQKLFAEEVAHRKTALEHSSSLTAGQRYVGQELKAFNITLDEDDPRRGDIAILERAYGSHYLTAAVQTELRRIRNHKLTGDSLFARLRDVYDQHNLRRLQEQVRRNRQVTIPRIICSEALV
ncbi:MAG: hypothetical protein ACYDC6_10805 [Acidobacteriaceae bacterium]